MKTIKDLINPDDPQLSIGRTKPQQDERESAKQERVWDRLWIRLSEIYGHQLASQYGETIPESWERLLTGITPDQIRDGLNRLATRKDTWPPNAAEFRNLCLPETISPDGKNSAAYLRFDDPKHPRNDPESPEFVRRGTKGIEGDQWKAKKKKAANSELERMKDMLK